MSEEFILPKSPVKAGFLSAFIPGAGQIYNEKYLKAAVFISGQSFLISQTISFDHQMQAAKRKRNGYDSNESPEEYYRLNNEYNAHWRSRQSFIFWIGTSVLLSSIEAYVDAHLINFNEKKNEIRLKFEEDKIIVSFIF